MESAQNSLNTGVQLIPSRRFRAAFHLYAKKYDVIVYRKMNIPGGVTKRQRVLLDIFSHRVKGMPYGVSSLFSFFTFAEGLHENRTFFCSELIAAAYRHCEILSKNVCTANCYPGHFGEDYVLEMNDGARLGPETILVRKLKMNRKCSRYLGRTTEVEPPSSTYVEDDQSFDDDSGGDYDDVGGEEKAAGAKEKNGRGVPIMKETDLLRACALKMASDDDSEGKQMEAKEERMGAGDSFSGNESPAVAVHEPFTELEVVDMSEDEDEDSAVNEDRNNTVD